MTDYSKVPARISQPRAYWSRLRAALHGVLAVLVMAITVTDELITALLALPAISPRVRRIWAAVVDEYRLGAMGAVDADIIDDEDERAV